MSNSKAPWLEVLDGGWPGSMRLRVQGSSMWPTLRPGDQVTVEPVTIDDLRTGDWVLLRGPSGLFLHRFLGYPIRNHHSSIRTRLLSISSYHHSTRSTCNSFSTSKISNMNYCVI